ncbi:cytochrome C [Lutibacter sp. HS1-25]|uniref:heme-binding domain-containing protein n=1 Tax=Lutibacter sp. HS1-25 TaxID=2485000 RepID=UPI001013109D|nr:heme-binding domain-containing protein [Lutibacter sp. HS1-25]RXP53623.1 cytochrome C [Lutibacter sp. HS1-25]
MKKVLLGILVLFILIQMVRPTKNDSKNDVNHISTVMPIPAEVDKILTTSCYDCHSNNTVYPWYSEIAPVSWFLAQHINEGKEHLNFSEWTVYNKNQQEHIANDLEEVLEGQGMPLKSYLLIHKDAAMTPEQYKLLLNWVESIEVE